jgi:ceramide synthetase
LVLLTTCGLSYARHATQKYVKKNYKEGYVSDVDKLSEVVWKALIYGFLWIFSIWVVFMQDFFWDTALCWKNWPNPPMQFSYKVWYFFQLGYYWSCCLFQTFGYDIRRKDEKQMMVHHICTILLITGSYVYGYSLIGGIILCLNDFNDFLLNFGKIFDYLGYKKVAMTLFPLFAITWFTNRILLGATKILGTSMMASTTNPNIPHFHVVLFNVGLVALFFLNCWWFFLIIKIVHGLANKKGKITDIREEIEHPPRTPKENRKENGSKNENGHSKNDTKEGTTERKGSKDTTNNH